MQKSHQFFKILSPNSYLKKKYFFEYSSEIFFKKNFIIFEKNLRFCKLNLQKECFLFFTFFINFQKERFKSLYIFLLLLLAKLNFIYIIVKYFLRATISDQLMISLIFYNIYKE